MMKFVVLSILSFFVAATSHASGDEIIGVWQNGTGKGHIEIFKQNGKYFGRIIWLKNPLNELGQPRLDKKNQHEHLRGKPLIGAIMLRDFVYDDGEWVDGRIYNPEDGKEYKAYMKMKDTKTLTVRGYIGFSWIGKTDVWQRVR
jgi:uncharacterized protein (DUF2147 family)